jgi:hypothetical protein
MLTARRSQLLPTILFLPVDSRLRGNDLWEDLPCVSARNPYAVPFKRTWYHSYWWTASQLRCAGSSELTAADYWQRRLAECLRG